VLVAMDRWKFKQSYVFVALYIFSVIVVSRSFVAFFF
jgi:hypothetical protein